MRPGPRPARPARAAATAAAALLALALAPALTGCDATQDAAGDLVSSATAAVASAAQEKLDQIKDGVNATGDVKAGPARADGDRTVAEITATNPENGPSDYTVMVTFRDAGGNLLDTVLVTLDGVPAGGSASGTARSNRSLSGAATAEIARAVRH